MNRQTRRSTEKEDWKPLVKGIAAAVCSGFLLLILFAFLMTYKDMGEMLVMGMSLAALTVASLIGGYVFAATAGKRGMKNGAIIGGILFLTVTAAGAIVNGLTFHGMILIKAGLCLTGGMLGGIAGVNKTAKRKL